MDWYDSQLQEDVLADCTVGSDVTTLDDYGKQQVVIDTVLAEKSTILKLLEDVNEESLRSIQVREWEIREVLWDHCRCEVAGLLFTKAKTNVGFAYVALTQPDFEKEYGPFEFEYIRGWIGPGKLLSETTVLNSMTELIRMFRAITRTKPYESSHPKNCMELENNYPEGCDFLVRILSRVTDEERKCLRREYYNGPIGWVCTGKVGIMIEKEEGVSVRMTLKEYMQWQDATGDSTAFR